MLVINSFKNNNIDTPNITFEITDLKTKESFKIFYSDNLDLYWFLNSNKESASFEIERSDLILFQVFKELFNNLRTNKLFYFKNEFFDDELYMSHINRIKPLLYDENSKTINFKSSDLKDWTLRDGKRDYFEIIEKDNSYILTFYNEGKEKYDKCCVRINTNRSEYESLVVLFTHFYKTLKDYYQCYQISLDDYSDVIKKLEKHMN